MGFRFFGIKALTGLSIGLEHLSGGQSFGFKPHDPTTVGPLNVPTDGEMLALPAIRYGGIQIGVV